MRNIPVIIITNIQSVFTNPDMKLLRQAQHDN